MVGAAPVLVVATRPDGEGAVLASERGLLRGLELDVAAVLAAEQAKGEPGEVVVVPVARDGVDSLLLAGVGDGSPAAVRKAASAAVRKAGKADTVASALVDGRDAAAVAAAAEGFGLAGYRFDERSDPKPAKPGEVVLVVDDVTAAQRLLDRAAHVVAAVRLARDLANTPSLVKTPEWMAEQARSIAAAAGLEHEIWDEHRLAAEGFGGVLAVGRGSSRPPRFVSLAYRPSRARRHVVLVGKGITFDSGGLSLKPLDNMKLMKTDMAGGAAVLAAMSALPTLGAQVSLTALVPLAENLPGADAMRPGDVVRHYGGRTTEVLNTDAEGRLVLADALAYAVAKLSPDAIVDLATLTGAATLGLGRRHAAMYTTSDGLRDELVAAADAAGERVWPMPLVDDYRSGLESGIADMRNVADPETHHSGGSIVAALFLREFAAGVPWAHLDIAGPARAESDEDEVTKGATGFGVRTLLSWLAPPN